MSIGTDDLKAMILAEVPADGAAIGNQSLLSALRKQLPKLTEAKYHAARDELISEGEFPPWTATDIGQLKSLAKQKAGAKKIAKALNRTPSATTVKAHTVTDGRESRARSCLGGTLFYENSDRSEYTGEVFVKFESWKIGIVPIEEGSLRQ